MYDSLRQQFFPAELIPGITTLVEADSSTFWAVVAPLMDQVFPAFKTIVAYEMPDARWEATQPLRAAFAVSHHERFIFYDADVKPIGWSYGDMRDSETFFMTSTGILSEFRGRGIYTAFVRRLLAYLAVLGYERVVSNHQTNNRAVIIAKLKLGFNVTAVNLDERWGAQVELTYLMEDDRRAGYERAFALEPRPTPISHRPS
jgi:GNAT superfamily N-acetyltransferase